MLVTVEPYSPQSKNGFHENLSKYRCCCGRLHARIGVSIFALVELIVFGIALGFSCYGIVRFNQSVQQTFVISILTNVCYLASIFVALYGIKGEHSHFLVPYAVVQAICILGSIVGFNFSLIQISMLTSVVVVNEEPFINQSTINYNWSYSVYRSDIGLCRGLVAVLAILGYFAWKIWILVAVSKCHAYLKDKTDHRIHHHHLHHYRYEYHPHLHRHQNTVESLATDSVTGLQQSSTIVPPCPYNQINPPAESPFELVQPRSPSESLAEIVVPKFNDSLGYVTNDIDFPYVTETDIF